MSLSAKVYVVGVEEDTVVLSDNLLKGDKSFPYGFRHSFNHEEPLTVEDSQETWGYDLDFLLVDFRYGRWDGKFDTADLTEEDIDEGSIHGLNGVQLYRLFDRVTKSDLTMEYYGLVSWEAFKERAVRYDLTYTPLEEDILSFMRQEGTPDCKWFILVTGDQPSKF